MLRPPVCFFVFLFCPFHIFHSALVHYTAGTVAKHGVPGSFLAVAAARSIAARAAALDCEAAASASTARELVSKDKMSAAAGTSAAAAAGAIILRRLLFNLIALVDHHLVPELQRSAEAAVLAARSLGDRGGEGNYSRGGVRRGRLAAYADLVAGVMSCGDYARKSASVEWALKLRSKI